MKDTIQFNGISSVDELLENNIYLLQVAVNRYWFRDEPDLDITVQEYIHVEDESLDVLQITAYQKGEKPLVPLVVNALINRSKNGVISLVPILVLDSRLAQYFSTQIYLTEEIFGRKVQSATPSIKMPISWRTKRPGIQLVGIDFQVTYKREDGKDSRIKAEIPSMYCLVEQKKKGLWGLVETLWN